MNRIVEWINRQTLSTKLKWVSMVTSGSVMLACTLFLVGIQVYFFTSSLVTQTQAQATVISENLSAALVFEDQNAAYDILAALRVVSEVESAVAYDRRKRVFASYVRTPGAMPALGAGGAGVDYRLDWHEVEVFQPVQVKGQRMGTIVVRSSLSTV